MDVSDPTVQAAFIAGITAVLAGLIGGWVGGYYATRATRMNLDDAAKARAEAREEGRQQRFADERRQLLTDLWIACQQHKREVEAQVDIRRRVDDGMSPTEWVRVQSIEPARQAYLALGLLSKAEVIAHARALLDATDTLSRNHAQVDGKARAFYAVDEDAWNRDLEAWTQASWSFAHWANEALVGPWPSHS